MYNSPSIANTFTTEIDTINIVSAGSTSPTGTQFGVGDLNYDSNPVDSINSFSLTAVTPENLKTDKLAVFYPVVPEDTIVSIEAC